MAEKRCPAFCNWIYDFETVCRILLKKNPQIANLVFYLWIFFQPPVSITTLATAKKLSMGPYGKKAHVPVFSLGTVRYVKFC